MIKSFIISLQYQTKAIVASVWIIFSFNVLANSQNAFELVQIEGVYLVNWKEGHSIVNEQKLKVFTQQAFEVGNLPPINGQIEIDKEQLLFRPTFPFRPGQSYVVLSSQRDTFYFTIPQPTNLNPPSISGIYPSADTLPANILKFYISFHQSMQEGQALKHIALIDEQGNELPNTFLELDPELWNSEHTRLTLWINPGRVKRELGPNQELGPAIEAGKKYHLRINSGWKNLKGIPIQEVFQKSFTATKADRQSPQPENWKLNLPKAASQMPLTIDFFESLDYALLQNSLHIFYENGMEIQGAFQLGKKEQSLLFTPDRAWQAGKYQLTIESKLEDLAANNLNRLFDTDLFKSTQVSKKEAYQVLPFEVME